MNIYSFLHKINVKDKNTNKTKYRTNVMLISFFISAAIMMFAPEVTRFSAETVDARTLFNEENKYEEDYNEIVNNKIVNEVVENEVIKDKEAYNEVISNKEIEQGQEEDKAYIKSNVSLALNTTDTAINDSVTDKPMEYKTVVNDELLIERDYDVTVTQGNMYTEELSMEEPLLSPADYEENISLLSMDTKNDNALDIPDSLDKTKTSDKSNISDTANNADKSDNKDNTDKNISNKAETENNTLTKTYNQYMDVELSGSDISILERIVEAEATGEDVYGKMLVANVVINRMNHEDFPNSVEGVVFQKGQFSPISDGRYYSVNVTKETVEAVKRVLKGEDYSEGAIYFFARSKTSAKKAAWFDSRLLKLFKYKGHEFFKEK